VLLNKLLLVFAGLSGCCSVAMGAFAAHALADKLSPPRLHAFETAVSYQLSHTLVLLLVCMLYRQWDSPPFLQYSSLAFAGGIVLFSGSLYLLTLLEWRWLGPVTPIGGVFLIVGWLLLCWGIYRGYPT
jgi:uncharacterized membrane protein YgdD (TMEM256/DUF423 family)